MRARVQELGLVHREKVNNAGQVMLTRAVPLQAWVAQGGPAAVELVARAVALVHVEGRARPARGARIDLTPSLCL